MKRILILGLAALMSATSVSAKNLEYKTNPNWTKSVTPEGTMLSCIPCNSEVRVVIAENTSVPTIKTNKEFIRYVEKNQEALKAEHKDNNPEFTVVHTHYSKSKVGTIEAIKVVSVNRIKNIQFTSEEFAFYRRGSIVSVNTFYKDNEITAKDRDLISSLYRTFTLTK